MLEETLRAVLAGVFRGNKWTQQQVTWEKEKDMKEKTKGDATSARPRGCGEQTEWVNPLKRGEETGEMRVEKEKKHCLIAVLLKRWHSWRYKECPRSTNTEIKHSWETAEDMTMTEHLRNGSLWRGNDWTGERSKEDKTGGARREKRGLSGCSGQRRDAQTSWLFRDGHQGDAADEGWKQNKGLRMLTWRSSLDLQPTHVRKTNNTPMKNAKNN